jgi:dihydroneopterin aldolase
MELARYDIQDLAIHAFIGLYDEEKRNGNDFLVNVTYWAPYKKASLSDQLEDAVNYGEICRLIESVFQKKCSMVEQIAHLTVTTLKEYFPEIQDLSVTITKLNPPVAQQVRGISITIKG